MSFKDWGYRQQRPPAMELGERNDPYWGRPGEGLDEVPLSARRQSEPEPSRVVDDGIPDLKVPALIRHHIRDWLVIILCIILDVILNVIHPYYRFVGVNNIDSLGFPYKSNTVPLWSVPLIAIGIPLTVFIGYLIKRRNTRDFHHAVLGLLTAIAVTAVFTDAVKDGVGRARPDFLARCFKDPSTPNFSGPSGNVLCDGDPSSIREGHKSFPSGHSSWSFAGLGYLSFYLAGKVTFFDKRGFSSRILFVFFPLLLAAMIAVSRVSDYWHHWTDVTVGGLLGLSIAYISYKQHFPDFSHNLAGFPHPHIHKSSTLPMTNRPAPRATSRADSRSNGGGSWEPNATRHPRATTAPFDVEAADM